MRIPAYQIYNVLQQYTDKLTSSDSVRDEKDIVQARPADDAGFFATIKRRELIETITETIKEKINRVKSAESQGRKNETRSPTAAQKGTIVKNGEFTPFVYNVIDKGHRKVKRTLSVTRFYEP